MRRIQFYLQLNLLHYYHTSIAMDVTHLKTNDSKDTQSNYSRKPNIEKFLVEMTR